MAAIDSSPKSSVAPRSHSVRDRIPVKRPSAVAPSSRSISSAGRRIARGQVLAARHGQAHRPLEDKRRGGDERLEQHQLAAESAAQRRGADPDSGAGNPNSSAMPSRVANGACVDALITSSPSGSSQAVAVWVSR